MGENSTGTLLGECVRIRLIRDRDDLMTGVLNFAFPNVPGNLERSLWECQRVTEVINHDAWPEPDRYPGLVTAVLGEPNTEAVVRAEIEEVLLQVSRALEGHEPLVIDEGVHDSLRLNSPFPISRWY